MPHSAVSQQQRKRAKTLRQTMTRAATLLWRYLKAHRVDGFLFRRQAPMATYVVDFVCHEAGIVVELDGETHDFDERLAADAARDKWLALRGYVVLRFTNEQVLRELEGVLTTIRQTSGDRARGTPLSLSLPRKGGGNPQTASAQVDESRPLRLRGACR